MLLLFLTLLAAAWGWELPQPQLRPLASGGAEFSIEDVPGIENLFFTYYPSEGKSVRGQAFRGFDGVWRHRNPAYDLSTVSETIYVVTAIFENGEIRHAEAAYISEPEAVLPPGGQRLRRAVVFQDDFNGPIDKNHWKNEVSMFGGQNWEFETYTPDAVNCFTRGGHLYLKPTFAADDPRFAGDFLTTGVLDVPEVWGYCTNTADYGCHRDARNGMLPPILSCKLSSIPTLKFGTVEVRAQIPRGDWIWPAIWMMPKASKYGTWPRSGELDIMESRGNTIARPNNGGVNEGTNAVSSTLHWGPLWNQNHFQQTHAQKTKDGPDYASDFHVYKLEWTPDHIATFIDGVQNLHVAPPAGGFYELGHLTGENPWHGASKMAPFDQDFYLIMNVAVGGTNTYFPDNYVYDTAKPWPNNSPHANLDFWSKRSVWGPTWKGDDVAMKVDYVKFSSL